MRLFLHRDQVLISRSLWFQWRMIRVSSWLCLKLGELHMTLHYLWLVIVCVSWRQYRRDSDQIVSILVGQMSPLITHVTNEITWSVSFGGNSKQITHRQCCIASHVEEIRLRWCHEKSSSLEKSMIYFQKTIQYGNDEIQQWLDGADDYSAEY